MTRIYQYPDSTSPAGTDVGILERETSLGSGVWNTKRWSFSQLLTWLRGENPIADTAVTPGTYGSTTRAPIFTVGADGRITAATDSAIAFPPVVAYVYQEHTAFSGGTGTTTTDVNLGGFTKVNRVAVPKTGVYRVSVENIGHDPGSLMTTLILLANADTGGSTTIRSQDYNAPGSDASSTISAYVSATSSQFIYYQTSSFGASGTANSTLLIEYLGT